MMADQQEHGSTRSGFSAHRVAADGTSYALSAEQVLGRSPDADITISDSKISRSHARFVVSGQQVSVEDLASANGTRVNQQRFEGPTVLRDGDVISFDAVRLNVAISGITPDDDVTVVDFGGDATVVGSMPEAAVDTTSALVADPAPAKPETEEPAAPEQVAPPPATSEPSGDMHSPDLPGSWIDQPTGEYTQVLSAGEAATDARADVNVESASDLPHLIIITPSSPQQVLELEPAGGEEADVWEIGREESCQIAIPDASVSARHAQLIHQNGRWRLVNLVSANGIYVNGKKRLTAFLDDGDKIKLGMASLIFKAGSGAVVAAAPTSIGRSPDGAGKNKLFAQTALAAVATAAAVGLWWFFG
jgi:pSer/pThr/pTyr-binding forkhead associated (FHA) protein